MPGRIRLEIDDVSAVAELRDDLSPKMVAALQKMLPLTVTLSHGKWSGRACFFFTGDSPLREVEQLEYPVCSIYPGFIVARPRGSELLMAYGQSEYRWNTGVDYTTPVAQIVENRKAFLDILESMHDVGDKQLTIRQEG